MENKNLTSPNQDSDEVPARFNIYILLVPLAFIVGLLVGYGIWGRNVPGKTTAAAQPQSAQPQAVGQSQPTVQATEQIKRYPVPVDDDPSFGPADAPITIIEFSDYQCPFCRKWFDEVYARLKETYPDKVRFVYRDFPLTNIHPEAQPAAEAADCANEQGVFWEYHDKLFGGTLELGQEAYIQYASELGLDLTKFKQCLEERRYQKEVEADLEYAANLGVNSTPTFFINGIPIIGAQPFEVFKYVIDKELAGEFPK